VDPFLLSVKKNDKLCRMIAMEEFLYLKVSVVMVDGETINSGQRNPNILWNKN
jgi:hypothetical protein